MTIEEAKEYIPDFDSFCQKAREWCGNNWYCRCYCDTLCKAQGLDFISILEYYARNGGEMYKVLQWLDKQEFRR